VLSAAEPGVCGDRVAGAGHGDVGEQQAGDALALAGWGGGVVPDAGQVGGELPDPGLINVRMILPDMGQAGAYAGRRAASFL